MTNQEFYRQLTNLAGSGNTAPQIPSLIQKARKEHLYLPVVYMGDSSDAEPVVIVSNGKKYIQCSTDVSFPVVMSVPKPKPGQKIGETALDGFFEQLIDCGYDGIVFLSPIGLIGLEWADLDRHLPAS